MVKHLAQAPTPIVEHMPNVRRELDELVLRCLAKNPADRPGSAFALMDQLAAIHLGEVWNNQKAESWWTAHMLTEQVDDKTDSSSETIMMGPVDTE